MEEEYDYIVLGTGLKECTLSGLLSCAGEKILHMDRNSYYGGESASLNLEDLFKRFSEGEKIPESLGKSRQYCVDLCPKLIMACGDLVKMLISTKVTRYLEFRSVAGSFVVQSGKVHKVPATPKEALASGLMGMFQKRRFKTFVSWVNDYEEGNPKTHIRGKDVNKVTSQEIYNYFKLEKTTQTFTGHALALYTSDDYLERPAREMIERVKVYANSTARYGNSPYIYPMYGLGGLPEGFSRLCAVHGGVYMLNKPIKEIVYDEKGVAKGIKDEEGKVASCKKGIIADPSYFGGTDKVKQVGQVARCICIMDHPIPNTGDADSCQIIIPFNEAKRKTDIYVSVVCYAHAIAAKGKYVAVVSAEVETDKPEAELDLAMKLLGKVEQKFFWVSDVYEAANDAKADECYITTSFDATTNFATSTEEVLSMYKKITGNDVDLTGGTELGEEDE